MCASANVPSIGHTKCMCKSVRGGAGGLGRRVTDLEDPPKHPQPASHTNKAPRSARIVRASCYRHVTVEELLSPFIFAPPKQKADPLLSSSAGRHEGGGTLVEPSSSPSETPGRRSTSQLHLTASLVSFHHQSLSLIILFSSF